MRITIADIKPIGKLLKNSVLGIEENAYEPTLKNPKNKTIKMYLPWVIPNL